MRQPSDISHPHSCPLGKGQQILWNEHVTNAIAYLTAMEQRKTGAKPAPCYHQLPPLSDLETDGTTSWLLTKCTGRAAPNATGISQAPPALRQRCLPCCHHLFGPCCPPWP